MTTYLPAEPGGLQITLDASNAAFHADADGHWDGEVSRILHDLADQIADGRRPTSAMDFNGNTVARLTYDRPEERIR